MRVIIKEMMSYFNRNQTHLVSFIVKVEIQGKLFFYESHKINIILYRFHKQWKIILEVGFPETQTCN